MTTHIMYEHTTDNTKWQWKPEETSKLRSYKPDVSSVKIRIQP